MHCKINIVPLIHQLNKSAGIGDKGRKIMKTKSQLISQGWIFTTLSGGAINASHLGLNKSFTACSLLTLRKKINSL